MREFVSEVFEFVMAWLCLLCLPLLLASVALVAAVAPAWFLKATEGNGWFDVWHGVAGLFREARAGKVLASVGVLGIFGLAMWGLTVLGYGTAWGVILMCGLGLCLGNSLVRVWCGPVE